jgi:hypothetical protein
LRIPVGFREIVEDRVMVGAKPKMTEITLELDEKQ